MTCLPESLGALRDIKTISLRGCSKSNGFPKRMKGDRELCMAAVAQAGHQLEFVSEELKGDREVCMAAVAQDWHTLQHCSGEMKGDRELCMAAITQNYHALVYASTGPH